MKLEYRLLVAVLCLAAGRSHGQDCGRSPFQENRIVGGVDSVHGAWPWQVDIQTTTAGHICGGSIISDSWVLSAAHCFPNPYDVSSYILYAGRYQLQGVSPHTTSHKVTWVAIMPGYTDPNKGNDMALVRIDPPFVWSDFVGPVCLPDGGTTFPPEMVCYVTGWGNIRQDVALPGVGTLQEVPVPIMSQSTCQEMYSVDSVSILSDMICAGRAQGGVDACQGDSGGPLVCKMPNNMWVQAGVVSFGLGCGRANQPGVYAKISAFSNFIGTTLPNIRLYSSAPTRLAGSTLLPLLVVACMT